MFFNLANRIVLTRVPPGPNMRDWYWCELLVYYVSLHISKMAKTFVFAKHRIHHTHANHISIIHQYSSLPREILAHRTNNYHSVFHCLFLSNDHVVYFPFWNWCFEKWFLSSRASYHTRPNQKHLMFDVNWSFFKKKKNLFKIEILVGILSQHRVTINNMSRNFFHF